jgi:hypothetical protein
MLSSLAEPLSLEPSSPKPSSLALQSEGLLHELLYRSPLDVPKGPLREANFTV